MKDLIMEGSRESRGISEPDLQAGTSTSQTRGRENRQTGRLAGVSGQGHRGSARGLWEPRRRDLTATGRSEEISVGEELRAQAEYTTLRRKERRKDPHQPRKQP